MRNIRQSLKQREILVPLLFLLTGMVWIFVSSYLVERNPLFSSLLISSDNYRDGLFMVLVAVVIYILLRKQREKDGQYQTLFNSSPVPMWIFNRKSLRFLDVNQAAIEHYGYTRIEFLQMTIKDIRPAFEHKRLAEHIKNIQGDQDNKDTWVHVTKGGEYITVTVVSSNVLFNGEVCRLSVANDITDMLRAQEHRQKAEAAAIEKTRVVEAQNRRLREIAFKASHVMRAPLTNILALIDLVSDPRVKIEEKETMLAKLKTAGMQFDVIIREIVSETFESPQSAMDWRSAHKAVLSAKPDAPAS